MNLKVIQSGVDRHSEREVRSMTVLERLCDIHDLRYIRLENPIYRWTPPLDNIIDGRRDWYVGHTKPSNTFGLTPRHYGCFLSHKQSMGIGFMDNDHFLVCECDLHIIDERLFIERLTEAVRLMDTTDYPMVRFESPNDCIRTLFYEQVSENIFECNALLGTHCYLVNGRSKGFWDNAFTDLGWHAADLWFNMLFERVQEKMLCFKDKLTHQYGGACAIDDLVKEDWDVAH